MITLKPKMAGRSTKPCAFTGFETTSSYAPVEQPNEVEDEFHIYAGRTRATSCPRRCGATLKLVKRFCVLHEPSHATESPV